MSDRVDLHFIDVQPQSSTTIAEAEAVMQSAAQSVKDLHSKNAVLRRQKEDVDRDCLELRKALAVKDAIIEQNKARIEELQASLAEERKTSRLVGDISMLEFLNEDQVS
jgi:chromosome segregation ATPase